MYVVKHRIHDIYWTDHWQGLTFEINKAKLHKRRPFSRLRYWNRQEFFRTIRQWEGLEIDMKDFEIRPVTINLL